jgi:hypothetical protein
VIETCVFIDGKCRRCGLQLGATAPREINVICGSITGTLGYTQPQPAVGERTTLGLGDYTEQLLSSIGVTKDRYAAAKELFGLAPTCNCETRKEWLNKVGAWLGL